MPRRPFPSIHRNLLHGAALACLSCSLFCLTAGLRNKDHPGRDGQDSVRLHADLIVVNAAVSNAEGRWVRGLTPKDFKIKEDGVDQTVDSLTAEEAPFAAAILVDASGSMDYKFGLVRAAAASFLEHIGEEDQVAVYGFNTKIRLYQDFSDSRDISDYIWDAKAEDATRLYDCMDTALDALAKRPERRRAELVITDGCDNLSKATLDSVLRKALSQAVTIYTVDLTDDDLILGTTSAANDLRRGRRDLEEMARRSGGVYIHSPKGDKLEESFTSVVDELRNQYTLTYYSTGQKRDGRWRKLDVAVSRPGITVRTRQGYYAPKGAS